MAKSAFHLVHGDDDFKVAESARELVNKICPPELQTTGLVLIDGAVDRVDEIEATTTKVIQGLFTLSLFGDQTTVWLKNASFLNPYKAPGNTAGAKDQVSGLLEKLKGGAPGNQLVISAPRLDKRSAFWKYFDKECSVVIHERPKQEYKIDQSATKTAGDWFKEAKVKAAPDVVKRFIQRAGNDSRQIRMEIDKLALFAGEGGTVTADMIQDLVSPARGAILWDFTDAFGNAQLERAVKLLHQLLGQRENPVTLLIQLTNRARELLVYRECMDRGWLSGERFSNSPEAEALLGTLQPDPRTIHPFRIKNLAAQARNYKVSRLVRIRDLFLDTHEKMIFGKISHPVMLEMAVIRAIGSGRSR